MFKKRNIFHKILSGFLSLLLLFQPFAPALILAQEEAIQVEEVSIQTEPSETPAPQPSEEPSATPSPTPEPIPSVDENLESSPATESALIDTSTTENQSSASLAPPVWQANSDGSATTINNVVLNQTYSAPQNDKVTVTFTKLPEPPGKLTIKQIILSQEDKEDLGAVSDTAYDITSTMENGTFEYTLTLPTPKIEGVEVKASEDGETFVTLGGVTAQTDTLTITGLNHFTIFLISADTNGTNGTGVYTATTGPSVVESAVGQVTTNLVLNVPSGFVFDTTTNSVTATVTNGSCSAGGGNKPIKVGSGAGSSSQTVTPTTTQITILLKQSSSGAAGCAGTITWSGIQVRPTAGTPLASGDITLTGTIGGATFNPNTFTEEAGAVNAGTSTVGASPTSVPADGTTTSTITVTLKDAFGNPVSGKTVTLSSSRGGTDTISAASGPSDTNGVVTFTVKSSTEGLATFTAIGDSVTITQTASVDFTNGHIIIVKDAISNNTQDFTFHNNFDNGNPDTFLLDDDGNEANALPKTRDFEVVPGNYSVSEDDATGWILSSAVCDNGSSVDNISVSEGETVTCTFTNKELGTIVLVKDTLGGDGTFDFEMSGQSLPNSTQITTTDGSGSQTFNDIDPDDTYSINENDHEGWDLTSSSCTGTNTPDSITPNTGEIVTCTFTNTKFGSISGFKFLDWNGNGVWDVDDEDPIEDWTIFLYQNGELINETTTDWWEWGDWGLYSFENLLPGTYLVCENLEDDTWTQTTPWDNSLCPDGTNGYEITLSAGETATEDDNGTLLYFGNFQYGRISGYKFEDLNGDKIRDDGESGLLGWTIFLDTNDDGILDEGEDSRITVEDGFYEFANLRGGTYNVREVPQEGWAQTTDNPDDLTITSGADVSGVDFGNFKKVIITGLKWKDLDADGQLDEGEPGIGGWNMDVSSVTTTSLLPDGGGEPIPIEIVQLQLTSQTDSSGQFSAVVDRPGTYRINEQLQTGFQQTNPGYLVDSFFDVFVEVSGQTTEGQDSITEDQNGNSLRFGNAPFQQLDGAMFVPTSGDPSATTSIIVLGDSTINVPADGGNSSIFLPDGTIITRSDGGTIDISQLSADAPSLASLTGFDSNTVVDGALQWGVPNLGLEFNPAITLNIFVGTAFNGQTLNVVRSPSGTGDWTSEGIVDPATCVVSDGICTFQATKASYYAVTHTVSTTTTTTTASTTGGGDGGGGGGAVAAPSCTDTTPGGTPLLLSASVSGPNQVTLTWSKALGPLTNYVISYGLIPGNPLYGNPNVGGENTTSYIVSNLSGGTTYYFRVRAGNGCAPGSYSNELSATPGGGIVTGPATGFAPGVLGVATEGNVGIGQEEVKGEATESTQPSATVTPSAQTSQSPLNIKTILIVVVVLLLGFGAFKLFVK